jgi:hypothetical protein
MEQRLLGVVAGIVEDELVSAETGLTLRKSQTTSMRQSWAFLPEGAIISAAGPRSKRKPAGEVRANSYPQQPSTVPATAPALASPGDGVPENVSLCSRTRYHSQRRPCGSIVQTLSCFA